MTKRPLRPKFLWNNAYLEKLATELGDECIFLCLSPVSFRMLTDMTKMLLWATRYEDREVPELGKTAYRELNVPCLEDFYSRLDELNNTDWLQGQFDALGSRMTELEQMDINVTQTVSGGCCSCDGETSSTSTSTNTVDGFTIDPEDTGIIPPYMTESIAAADAVRCRAANYLAVSFVSGLRRLEQMGDEAGALVVLVGVIVLAVTALSPVLGDEVIAWSAFVRWAYKALRLRGATGMSSSYFRVLADNIENDLRGFVCAIYTWDTAEELGAAFILWVNARVDELQSEVNLPAETVLLYKDFINAVYGAEMINWFVENIASVAPADFIPQYDCLCGATGDSCPTQNIVLAGYGTLPAGDLTGNTEGAAAQFKATTGFYELTFELAANYCVTIQNSGDMSIEEMHQVCIDGVMSPSDGSCIRRYAARSQAPFAAVVTFVEQTVDCACAGVATGDWVVVPNSSPECTENMQLSELPYHPGDMGGEVSYSGTIAKGGQYGAYSFSSKMINPSILNNYDVVFENVQQDQNKIVTIVTTLELGSTSETLSYDIPVGGVVELSFDNRVVLDVRFITTVGIYNLPCPTACSGMFRWHDV